MPGYIHLEAYRKLFASDEAMREFAMVLKVAADEVDTPAVTFQNDHLITVLSPATTQAVLRDRILKRLAEKPDTMDRFVTRISQFTDSDLVD